MGCCHSTARDDNQPSPYSPSNTYGDSSSRAITSTTTPVPEIAIPRVSSHVSAAPATPAAATAVPAPRQPRSRRIIGLTEQFNLPLRAHVWNSKRVWTRSQLERERQEFFDTRVTGREEIWATLKVVVGMIAENEIQNAQGILDASAITVPTGDLINGAYDEVGNFYQMPEHIISDPANLVQDARAYQENIKGESSGDEETDEEDSVARRREEKGKDVLKAGDIVRVKARLSDRGGPDIVVAMGRQQNVRMLVRRIQEETNIPGTPKTKIKIAYLGKILKEGETLLAQGWREGHVVNVLVFGNFSAT